MHRRHFLLGAGAAVLTAFVWSRPSLAHHGWAWATDEEFRLTGVIKAAKLGNPHGELTVDVKGEDWIIEIGQPWRNDRVDLSPQTLAEGTEVTAFGHRSANTSERLMKAERLVIAGRDYNLYPDRAS